MNIFAGYTIVTSYCPLKPMPPLSLTWNMVSCLKEVSCAYAPEMDQILNKVLHSPVEVIKDVPAEYENGNSVTFSCEFSGYYPKGKNIIQWDFEGQALSQDDGKYAVSLGIGRKGLSQSGEDFTAPSMISSLTIFRVDETDRGIYGCRIIGDSCHQLIGYIQINNGGKHMLLHASLATRNLANQT